MKVIKSIFSKNFIAYIIFIILFSSLTVACKKDTLQEMRITDTELESIISRTEVIYKEYCSGCHGNAMQTFVDEEWIYGNSPKEIYTSIAEGRAEGEMPSFKDGLSKKEMNELVVTILHQKKELDKYDLVEESETYQSKDFSFKLEKVVENLESPWGMVFLPEGDLLVTDKSGELWRVKKDKSKIEVTGVPEVLYKGQGGLMDIELHPNFSENNLLYLSYSIYKREGGEQLSSTAVSKYKLRGNKLVDGEMIFEAFPYSTTRRHYGSRLEFDNNGYLFITIGDRGARDVNPQNLSLFPGKVHRLYDDGRIPEDNPFVDEPDAIKSIYSYGHRNQQGMIKHPVTGEIWTHEHGPKGGDEINIVEKGLNYGWPVISYGVNYSGTKFTDLTAKEGMEQPLHYWTPSIAPSGMDFVRGSLYPGWEGNLLVGSLRFEFVKLCKIEGTKLLSEETLMEDIGRVRNIKQGPDGYIYVGVEDPGVIYKIIPLSE